MPNSLELSVAGVNCLVVFPTHLNPNNFLLILLQISHLFMFTPALSSLLKFSDEHPRPFHTEALSGIPIEISPVPNDCSVHNQIPQHEPFLEVGSRCPASVVHLGSE